MFDINKITEFYCVCDDFCKEFNQKIEETAIKAPAYRGYGKRKPQISDAEIITILIVFHTNTFRNFKHYYINYVLIHPKNEFPSAPSYSRFVSLMKRVGVQFAFFLCLCLFGECTGLSFVDSTCMSVCHNKRILRNKVFNEYASRGNSTMGWYFGFKLHLLCNECLHKISCCS